MFAILIVALLGLLILFTSLDLICWYSATTRKRHADLRERIRLLNTVEYLPDLIAEQKWAFSRLLELRNTQSLEYKLVSALLIACNDRIFLNLKQRTANEQRKEEARSSTQSSSGDGK